MRGFYTKLAFDVLYKSQTPNGNCFQPSNRFAPLAGSQALPLPIGGVFFENLQVPQNHIAWSIFIDRSPHTARVALESHDNRCALTLQDG